MKRERNCRRFSAALVRGRQRLGEGGEAGRGMGRLGEGWGGWERDGEVGRGAGRLGKGWEKEDW